MFSVSRNSGFSLTFENQWMASVQFGPCTYSSHYDENDFDAPQQTARWESNTAEIAAWHGTQERDASNWYNFGDNQVKGWCTADNVVDFLAMVSKLPPRKLTEADYLKR
jgi:hypothetical protein